VMSPSRPDAYDFRWEVLGADGKWSAVSEGRATRVKGK